MIRNLAFVAFLTAALFQGNSCHAGPWIDGRSQRVTIKYKVYRGTNLVCFPFRSPTTLYPLQASEVLELLGASAIGRVDLKPPWKVLPYIKGVSGFSDDFIIDPTQSYFVLSNHPAEVSISGFVDAGDEPAGMLAPTFLRGGHNPWGLPKGVPYFMTYEDLRLWPLRGGLTRDSLLFWTTDVAPDGISSRFVTYIKGMSPNGYVQPGQGFLMFIWKNSIRPGFRLPSEATAGYAKTMTTVGRPDTNPGTPDPTSVVLPSDNTPMNSPEGVRSRSKLNPALVAYADTGNHTVRRTVGFGTICERVAGIDGQPGFDQLESGLLPNQAKLDRPTDVELEAPGTQAETHFIADSLNKRIRSVVPGKSISTIAGGGNPFTDGLDDGVQALRAHFPSPVSVCISGGTVFVADEFGKSIRKFPRIPSGTRLVSYLVAPVAPLAYEEGLHPSGVSLSLPGRMVAATTPGILYVADRGRGNVRKIDMRFPGQETVFTVVGTTNQLAGENGKGATVDGGRGTDVKLKEPWGVATDQEGMLYVSDAEQGKIFKIGTSEQRVAWVAGSGSGIAGEVESMLGSLDARSGSMKSRGLHTLEGPVLHFSDALNNRIRRIVVGSPVF